MSIRQRNIAVFVLYCLMCIIILSVGIPAFKRAWLKPKASPMSAVDHVTFYNPDGSAKEYDVAKWLSYEKGIAKFIATDGRKVTLNGNKVTED